jgi:hypothetical protein
MRGVSCRSGSTYSRVRVQDASTVDILVIWNVVYDSTMIQSTNYLEPRKFFKGLGNLPGAESVGAEVKQCE